MAFLLFTHRHLVLVARLVQALAVFGLLTVVAARDVPCGCFGSIFLKDRYAHLIASGILGLMATMLAWRRPLWERSAHERRSSAGRLV